MPKQPVHSSGRSKIRLLYVDADLVPGEIQDLTKALADALRPTHLISRVAIQPRLSEQNDVPQSGETVDEQDTAADIGTPSESTDNRNNPSKPPQPRKYRSPNIVNDLDMTGKGKLSFETFASQKGDPAEHTKRYLVASYWLAECAGISPVSVDHIYTCYKSAQWTFDIVDPVLPFRRLKTSGFGDIKNSQFTINHIGRGRVEKLKGSEE